MFWYSWCGFETKKYVLPEPSCKHLLRCFRFSKTLCFEESWTAAGQVPWSFIFVLLVSSKPVLLSSSTFRWGCTRVLVISFNCSVPCRKYTFCETQTLFVLYHSPCFVLCALSPLEIYVYVLEKGNFWRKIINFVLSDMLKRQNGADFQFDVCFAFAIWHIFNLHAPFLIF